MGYSEEIFQTTLGSKLSEYKCLLCFGVLEDPKTIEPCGCTFCAYCISKCLDLISEPINLSNSGASKSIQHSLDKQCPICKREGKILGPSSIDLCQRLACLPVRCTFEDCQEIVPFRRLVQECIEKSGNTPLRCSKGRESEIFVHQDHDCGQYLRAKVSKNRQANFLGSTEPDVRLLPLIIEQKQTIDNKRKRLSDENDKLKKQIDEIKRLTAENGQLNKEIDTSEKQIKLLGGHIENFKIFEKFANDDNRRLTAENEELKQQNCRIEEILEQNNEINREIGRLTVENEELKQQNCRIEEILEQNNEINREIGRLTVENEELKQQNCRIEEILEPNEINREIERLTVENELLKVQNKEIIDENKELTNENNKFIVKTEELKKSNEKISRNYRQSIDNEDTLESENKKLKYQIIQLEKANNENLV